MKTLVHSILFALVAILLVVCVLGLGYLTVFQIAPALKQLNPDLDTAVKLASVLGISGSAFTIIFVILAVHDRFWRNSNRVSEWRQKQFERLVEIMPNLVEAQSLRLTAQQIEDALADANLGAAFGKSFAEAFNTGQHRKELLDAISKGMDKYRLILPNGIKPIVVGLADVTKEADHKQGEIFKKTVRATTPLALSQWILAEALKKKDLSLLKAARTLGIDSLAVESKRYKDLAESLQELI